MLMLGPNLLPGHTRLHLIRHGAHSEFGRLLSGRAGVPRLTARGRAQASSVAEWTRRARPVAVHASPRARTMETALIIASAHALGVHEVDALDEVDFGAWNGRSFAELADDPLWQHWNGSRSLARTPNGETMMEAVMRAIRHIEDIAHAHPGETILCVTHCDIIRGAIAHYLGLSLDNILRFDVDPGSISTVELGAQSVRVTRINEVPA